MLVTLGVSCGRARGIKGVVVVIVAFCGTRRPAPVILLSDLHDDNIFSSYVFEKDRPHIDTLSFIRCGLVDWYW